MQTTARTAAVLDRSWIGSIKALPIASAELSRRVEKVVGYPPLSELDDLQRREFHEALVEAGTFRRSAR
jgi:hypothetical protein